MQYYDNTLQYQLHVLLNAHCSTHPLLNTHSVSIAHAHAHVAEMATPQYTNSHDTALRPPGTFSESSLDSWLSLRAVWARMMNPSMCLGTLINYTQGPKDEVNESSEYICNCIFIHLYTYASYSHNHCSGHTIAPFSSITTHKDTRGAASQAKEGVISSVTCYTSAAHTIQPPLCIPLGLPRCFTVTYHTITAIWGLSDSHTHTQLDTSLSLQTPFP